MKRATLGACTLLSVSSVFLLPAPVNMVGTKSSSSLMQVTSGYEAVDCRKDLESKGEHGNSMADMSLPQDGTWTDPGTGLMWTKEDNGSRINWNEANQYCRDMRVKQRLTRYYVKRLVTKTYHGSYRKSGSCEYQGLEGRSLRLRRNAFRACDWLFSFDKMSYSGIFRETTLLGPRTLVMDECVVRLGLAPSRHGGVEHLD